MHVQLCLVSQTLSSPSGRPRSSASARMLAIGFGTTDRRFFLLLGCGPERFHLYSICVCVCLFSHASHLPVPPEVAHPRGSWSMGTVSRHIFPLVPSILLVSSTAFRPVRTSFANHVTRTCDLHVAGHHAAQAQSRGPSWTGAGASHAVGVSIGGRPSKGRVSFESTSREQDRMEARKQGRDGRGIVLEGTGGMQRRGEA